MPSKSRKQRLGSEQNESKKNYVENVKNNDNNNFQDSFCSLSDSYEIVESPSRSPFNKIFNNILKELSVNTNQILDKENKAINTLLEITNKILIQNTSIMEKQGTLEVTVTQLASDIKKRVTQGIKFSIDNWLYPNDKVYEESIYKELEELCPDKMMWSFYYAVFKHVFKNKILQTVNSESSETEIISWKSNKEVQWCFENLNTMIEEEDKTYYQMVAKKVFG
ncbi:22006_t:CDS:2 [Cetraspora pellucida]|uniref:22006_t:CDS:1 n=1 Tax=Cetraspora pellucida TaxID=1433469 RepID=A0A9N9HHZ4_9GLOM|nr:22006_t:CDS:2 [Cetraspora pellucida]